MENDPDRIKLMNSMLLSMPGSPILYYGDEMGMGDNIYLGDRNGVRTPMQWSPDRNAGFSRADPARLYTPLTRAEFDSISARTVYHPEARNDYASLHQAFPISTGSIQTGKAHGQGAIPVMSVSDAPETVAVHALCWTPAAHSEPAFSRIRRLPSNRLSCFCRVSHLS